MRRIGRPTDLEVELASALADLSQIVLIPLEGDERRSAIAALRESLQRMADMLEFGAGAVLFADIEVPDAEVAIPSPTKEAAPCPK